MKTPPLFLGAALLFWGWQTQYFVAGVVMALVLESAWVLKARWEFAAEDFQRVWTFTSLLFLAAVVYAFTSNEGPASFTSLFQHSNYFTQREAGAASSRTASAIFSWLPMLFFPFLVAHSFSTSETIPLTAISFLAQRRLKQARLRGVPPPPPREIRTGFPYFAVCLLAACIHPAENTSFFWGFCLLLAWALWTRRSRRFGVIAWAGALGACIALGYFGQQGIGLLQDYLQNLAPKWIAALVRRNPDPRRTSTAIGRIGELKLSGRIVIHLETRPGAAPPTYLREASYRYYSKYQVWHNSYSRSSRSDFLGVPETPADSRSWPLLPDKTNAAVVNIACFLEGSRSNLPSGLLPLPSGSGLLERLPAYILEKNSAGAVLAQGPAFLAFDALYGPGATIDSPADSTEDLSLPDRERPALEAVLGELQLRGQKPGEQVRALTAFFASHFAYGTWQETDSIVSPGGSPLSRFLLYTRKGHCEYFASATVLLLRCLGIPARVAVGYAVHEGAGNKYVVRLRDAHAWCLVWDEAQKTWIDLDTTPASWVQEEAKRASRFQGLSDLLSRLRFEFARLRWGQTHIRQYLLWLILPALVVPLYQILFRRRRGQSLRRRNPDGRDAGWQGLDSEFYQLEKKLRQRGLHRDISEPLPAWLHRLAADPGLAPTVAPFHGLLRLHYRYRFDPLGLTRSERNHLKHGTQAALAGLATRNPRSPS